jgi:hypothetical protein
MHKTKLGQGIERYREAHRKKNGCAANVYSVNVIVS